MPATQDIMTAIMSGLNGLPSNRGAARRPRRTEAIKDELCMIGRDHFHCVARAAGVNNADRSEWLYDVRSFPSSPSMRTPRRVRIFTVPDSHQGRCSAWQGR